MKKFIAINAGIAALVGSGMAEAGFSPYYVGAAIGTTTNNGSESQFCPECEDSIFTLDKRNPAKQVHKVYGGTNFNSNLGVEVEYANLGDTYSLDMYRPEFGVPGNRAEYAKARQKTRGIGVSAKARKHLTRKTAVFAKGGAFAWENRNSMDYTNLNNINVVYKTKDRGVSPVVGVGIEHEVSDRWSVRAGVDRYLNTGKGNNFLYLDEEKRYDELRSVKTDSTMIYVGATFNF